MARKIRDYEDALDCLDAWEASGLTLPEWARAHHIDGRSLNCWKRNVGWEPREGKLIQLLPIGAVDGARYTIRVGHAELDVGDDFNEDTLRRLLGVLTAC